MNLEALRWHNPTIRIAEKLVVEMYWQWAQKKVKNWQWPWAHKERILRYFDDEVVAMEANYNAALERDVTGINSYEEIVETKLQQHHRADIERDVAARALRHRR